MDYNYAFKAISHASVITKLLVCIVIIVLYLLKAIGLMKISQNTGESKSWLAFIPVVNSYLLGKMVFKEIWITWVLVVLSAFRFTWPVFVKILAGNNNFSIATLIISIFYFAIYFIALYKLYDRLSDKAIIMTVFTVLTCGLIAPVFLFVIRNNTVRK